MIDIKRNITILTICALPFFDIYAVVTTPIASLSPWRIGVIILIGLSFSQKKIALSQQQKQVLSILALINIYSTTLALFSDDPKKALVYELYILIGSLFLLASTHVCNTKKIKTETLTKTWATSFSLLITAYAYLYSTGFIPKSSRYFGEQIVKPTGFFHNENNFAIYIALSIPIILSSMALRLSALQVLYLLALSTSVFFLIIINSQGALLLAFTASLLYMLLRATAHKKIAFFISLLAFAIALGFSITDLNLNNNWLDKQIEILASKGTEGARIELIKASTEAAANSGLLGLGPGQVEQYIGENYSGRISELKNPHNFIFEIFANFGIIGITLTISLLFLIAFYSSKKYLNKKNQPENSALLSIILTFPIWQSVPSSLIASTILWSMLALLLCNLNSEKPESDTQPSYHASHFN